MSFFFFATDFIYFIQGFLVIYFFIIILFYIEILLLMVHKQIYNFTCYFVRIIKKKKKCVEISFTSRLQLSLKKK